MVKKACVILGLIMLCAFLITGCGSQPIIPATSTVSDEEAQQILDAAPNKDFTQEEYNSLEIYVPELPDWKQDIGLTSKLLETPGFDDPEWTDRANAAADKLVQISKEILSIPLTDNLSDLKRFIDAVGNACKNAGNMLSQGVKEKNQEKITVARDHLALANNYIDKVSKYTGVMLEKRVANTSPAPVEFPTLKLTSTTGAPIIGYQMKNTSDKTLVAIDVRIRCKNSNGDIVKANGRQEYAKLTHQTPLDAGATSAYHETTLFGFDATTSLEVAVERYELSEDSDIVIPEEILVWIPMQ